MKNLKTEIKNEVIQAIDTFFDKTSIEENIMLLQKMLSMSLNNLSNDSEENGQFDKHSAMQYITGTTNILQFFDVLHERCTEIKEL